MAMIPVSNATDQSDRQRCACCSDPIRHLGDQRSLSLFLEEKALQRRAYQCMNCGMVICRECRENGAACTCRSNAWLARPYLDPSVGRSI